MKRLAIILAAGIVLAGVAPHSAGATAKSQSHARMDMAPAITVLVGQGQSKTSPGSQLAFTPKYVDVSVGDMVAFKDVDQLEPHTVTFGTMAVLTKMANGFISPIPQKNGPPILALDPKGIAPTMSKTYDGTGVANSGILSYGKTWSLQFTKPGTYHYICLIHGLSMAGYVTVHALAPAGPSMWIVQAGDGQAAGNDKANTTTNDSFYPRHLTVKVGDTVMWIGGFHTITFGPDSVRTQLEKNLFIPIPGAAGGPGKLMFNPKVAFPSGGSTYDGTGFVNSGVLALNAPQNSKAPPSFKLKFTKAGTYEYDCLIHPGMDGTITVSM